MVAIEPPGRGPKKQCRCNAMQWSIKIWMQQAFGLRGWFYMYFHAFKESILKISFFFKIPFLLASTALLTFWVENQGALLLLLLLICISSPLLQQVQIHWITHIMIACVGIAQRVSRTLAVIIRWSIQIMYLFEGLRQLETATANSLPPGALPSNSPFFLGPAENLGAKGQDIWKKLQE